MVAEQVKNNFLICCCLAVLFQCEFERNLPIYVDVSIGNKRDDITVNRTELGIQWTTRNTNSHLTKAAILQLQPLKHCTVTKTLPTIT